MIPDWNRWTPRRADLPEILDERYGRRSTIITRQLPVENWHVVIGNPTYVDAIHDRLVHIARRLNLSGESLRRDGQNQPNEVDQPKRPLRPITSHRGSKCGAASGQISGRHRLGSTGRHRRNRQSAGDGQMNRLRSSRLA
jgi:hypothetical protein